MKTKLFVGNLNFDTTEEQLRKLFEPYGSIESVTIVTDKRSGRSKGYGFVQMIESKDAAKSLEISGQEFMGRDIVVTEAESPGEGKRQGRRGRPGDGGRRPRHPRRSGGGKPQGRNRTPRKSTPQKKSVLQKIAGFFGFGKSEKQAAPASSSERKSSGYSGSRRRRSNRYRGRRPRRQQSSSSPQSSS